MVDLVPKGSLFGHRAPVNAMAVTRSFSTLLSSSTDGAILLWDLNRLELVRVVAEGKPIDVRLFFPGQILLCANDSQCAVINDTTGTMLLCAGPKAALYTLNGDLLLEQHVCAEGDEAITSCAFYEGSGNEYLEQNLVFTGHRRGAVNVRLYLYYLPFVFVSSLTLPITDLEHCDPRRKVCARPYQAAEPFGFWWI